MWGEAVFGEHCSGVYSEFWGQLQPLSMGTKGKRPHPGRCGQAAPESPEETAFSLQNGFGEPCPSAALSPHQSPFMLVSHMLKEESEGEIRAGGEQS